MTPIADVLRKAARLHEQGKPEQALVLYELILGKTIQDPYVLFLISSCYVSLQRFGTAMNLLMRAINLCDQQKPPKWMADAWNNLGVCMRNEAHEDEAIAAYQQSIKMEPEHDSAWANLCGVYVNYGDPKPGIEIARKALALNHFNAQAGHHLGMLLLEDHQYEEGWRWYGSRMRVPEFHHRRYGDDVHQWFGEELRSEDRESLGDYKVLAIHGEQGIGDEILFLSLLPKVLERVDRVVVECAERLIPVVERSFPGVLCYPTHQKLMDNERPWRWTPMGSLPGIFKVTEPLQHRGYLKPSQGRVDFWKRELMGGYRVGISWRGGTKKTHEHLRNFDLAHWKKLIDSRPDLRFVSLQYGDAEADAARLGIQHAKPRDFDDHMAMIASCDLVISVCNTTVHQAGSMNVPVKVLVPSAPAWRYGTRGNRMLWYPSALLYRQDKNEDWGNVIERVAADLRGVSEAQPAAA